MPKGFRLLLFVLIILGLSSCRWWTETRIQSQNVSIQFIDFFDSIELAQDKNGQEQATQLLQRWNKTQSPFFPYFCEGVIVIGHPDSTSTGVFFTEFVHAPIVRNAKSNIDKVFDPTAMKVLKTNITDGFKHFHFYFPEAPLPTVYFYNSGYNTSLMLGESFVGASLEKFLGDTAQVYTSLGIPAYFYPNMNPKNIPIELLGAWFHSICPEPDNCTLLDRMMWEGKKAYCLTQFFPSLSESFVLGYSKNQWSILEEQEMALWAKLVEDRLLFEKQAFLITQVCEPAPFTALIAQSTPGRAGSWMGYRIVKKYMEAQKTTLLELIQHVNSQELLQQSQYKP